MKNNCVEIVEPCWLSMAFIKSIVHHRMGGRADLNKELENQIFDLEKFLESLATGGD